MAKKIRFPLEMENGIKVRSMEELRENFSISRVLGYLQDGKLTIWLRDRYANDISELIEQLDLTDEELPQKVCEIFDVLYDESTEKELEKVAERKERILRLKQYSEDREYEKVREFADKAGLPIVGEIARSEEITRCEDKGMTVVEGAPDSEVSQAFLELAKDLLAAEECGTKEKEQEM